MAEDKEPTIIKKYANRRLYNTGTSTYVTLDDLGEMVKSGEDFVVMDAKSGDDITRSVLTQIIFEQESRGQNLLPINFLRQLIRFYGDSMQTLVPSYLDFSMNSLARNQEKLRAEMTRTLGATALGAMEEQARRNMAMFEQAFRVFTPFPPDSGSAAQGDEVKHQNSEADSDAELDALKKQLSDMQARLDQLSRK
jgi:polyhydroxyalkanoate synthesis repressor PhaR